MARIRCDMGGCGGLGTGIDLGGREIASVRYFPYNFKKGIRKFGTFRSASFPHSASKTSGPKNRDRAKSKYPLWNLAAHIRLGNAKTYNFENPGFPMGIGRSDLGNRGMLV